MTTANAKHFIAIFLLIFFFYACENTNKKNSNQPQAVKPSVLEKNSPKATSNAANTFKAQRIAHAGGGIDGNTYTNSYRALNENIKKGFKYFELDFSFTSDGHLVCLHDWNQSFKRSFGIEASAEVSLIEFEQLVQEKANFDKCTAKGLAQWMNENPQAIIITDVKQDNMRALEILYTLLPDAKRRVIPQIYQPENFQKAKKLGYEKIIWTLYRVNHMSLDDVLVWVAHFEPPFAVTMPKSRAVTWLPKQLHSLHIPTYVHTINSMQEAEFFHQKQGITEIYTDFLTPDLSLISSPSGSVDLP